MFISSLVLSVLINSSVFVLVSKFKKLELLSDKTSVFSLSPSDFIWFIFSVILSEWNSNTLVLLSEYSSSGKEEMIEEFVKLLCSLIWEVFLSSSKCSEIISSFCVFSVL